MTKDFVKWLRDYDHFRTSGERNNWWVSTKYDIDNKTWAEISEIEVVGLNDEDGNVMKWGQACSSMIKSWDRLKQIRKDGENGDDLQYRILRIQRKMGIHESDFPITSQEWVDYELDREDEDLETDEDEEEDEDWENW